MLLNGLVLVIALINPPRKRLCVCVSVCLLSHISVSVRPENAVTYSVGNRGKKFVGFSLKPLRCRDPALPPLNAIRTVGHFPTESVHAHYSIYHLVSSLRGVSCVY